MVLINECFVLGGREWTKLIKNKNIMVNVVMINCYLIKFECFAYSSSHFFIFFSWDRIPTLLFIKGFESMSSLRDETFGKRDRTTRIPIA